MTSSQLLSKLQDSLAYNKILALPLYGAVYVLSLGMRHFACEKLTKAQLDTM